MAGGIGASMLVIVVLLGVTLLGGGSATAHPTSTVITLAPGTPDGGDSSSTATAEATASPTASATASATPGARALPAMLAAIGDSYTQAWSVSPSYKRDHPQFSWAVGTAKGDGVFSLRERFEALGDKLLVNDVATSGRKMSDAPRQAGLVVAQAAGLPSGSTVFVTFELGTNDLCDDPMTPAATFEAQLREAMTILEGGLPKGSQILMISVPDFVHFWEITQANPAAKAALKLRVNSQNCAPFLGSRTHSTFAQSKAMLAAYDSILASVCDEVESKFGPSGQLHCHGNPAALSDKDFVIKDLSTADYFHPSLSGQAKMATAAWGQTPWSVLPIPPGSAA